MRQHTPPRTPYEEAILAIWRDVLGRSAIGVHDNFFAVGGRPPLVPTVAGRIRTSLGVHIPVTDFFESPTVAALASAVAARTSATAGGVRPRPPDAEPVLSFDQQRLWLESQLLPGAAYNIHHRLRLVGPIDIGTLEASVRVILARHEVLRTRFPTVAGRPVQVVDEPDEGWCIDVKDVTDVHGDRTEAARRLASEHAAVGFDLAEGPLFRCQLIKVSDREHLLGVTVHHIVFDAWSAGLLMRELSALYRAGGDAARAELPTLPFQYRDYAVWQREWLAGDKLKRLVNYWLTHLDGAPPALQLPTAKRPAAVQVAESARTASVLSEEDTAALHDLCHAYDVTVFMALLASFATVLARWSGQRDIVIGVPFANRTDRETSKLIGFFVNTLPLRVDLSGEPTFAELLAQVRQVAVNGYAHADAPYDVLVQELKLTRDPRRTPIFQVVLNVLDNPEIERVAGVLVEPAATPPPPANFDLALSAREANGTLELRLDFNTDRYQATMMRALVEQVRALLRAVPADPTRGIVDYPLQTTAAKTQPADHVVTAPHRAVEWWCTRRPDQVAVIDGDGEWSYRWLHRAAERVARTLAERAAARGDQLNVVRRPTAAFVAAVLGGMKAGVRLSVIEADDPVAAEGALDPSVIPHDQHDPVPPRRITAAAPAAPMDDWAAERFPLGAADRFTVLSGPSSHLFSALSSALCVGATLAIPDPGLTRDIGALIAWLRTNAISVIYLNPPMLRALAGRAPGSQLPALRFAFVDNSGEFVSHDVDALRRLSAACRCVGMYRVGRDGRPLMAYAVPDSWHLATAPLRVSLGTELPGAPARLVHPSGQAAAVGEVGELCWGAHRTGDLGRRWHDGTVEFVSRLSTGRVPDPVEAMAALRDVPTVQDAVVIEHAGTDGALLVGYLAGPDPALDTAGIRRSLLGVLPEYLVPAHLVVLSELPLTRDGDYDLGALPAPRTESHAAADYVAPRTPMERQLAGILAELLGLEHVGVHHSFFELGGFSLLATQLVTRIRETFDVELSLREVFEAPTVDGLAQLIVRWQGELSSAADLEALLTEIGG